MSVAAVAARAAGGEREDDVVAGLDPADRGADLFDDAGAFESEHAGERQPAVGHAQVGAAQPRGDHADEDLVRADLVELHVADRERRAC